MRSRIRSRWIGFLLETEGSAVVLEPNGRYSRYGVTVSSREEAEGLTYNDMVRAAIDLWEAYHEEYSRVARNGLELLRLMDFTWNAGPGNARRIIQSGSIASEIAFYYETLATQSEAHARYRKGWRRRRERLREVYYDGARFQAASRPFSGPGTP